MPPVRIADGALYRGNVRIPLLMGEMHYWRTSPYRWPDILRAFRRLNVDIVATYVPWQYHELAPGDFDFTGRTEPQRNLLAFLDLLHAEGFHCFIRPGPYIYSEWTNAGVPDRVAVLPRISDAYRAESLVWMRAVTDALRPYFATSTARFPDGGPIILFQPDNEVDLFSHWFESDVGLDPGPRTQDPGLRTRNPGLSPNPQSPTPDPQSPSPRPRVPASPRPPSPFHTFLLHTYPDIAALNAAWNTNYASFDEAQPAASVPDRFDRAALARARDYWRFQHWATAQIVDWHTREYRALGVDLPMLANYYPGGDVQNWRELSKTSIDLLAIDWYPRNEFTGPPPPPGASGATGGGGIFGLPPHREHRVFLDSCRLQSAVSPIPLIAELECGVWHGYQDYTGPFSPNHYRLLVCSALLAGIRGWNWYMLAGRDNWYFTPINERGDLRPELAEEFLRLHDAYAAIDPTTLEKLADAGAFFDLGQIGPDDLLGNNPVLQALYDARLDYHLFDADALAAAIDAGRAPRLLFYAASDWLEAPAADILNRYIDRGGTLVLFRNYPRADGAFRAANPLQVQPPARILSHLGKKVEIDLGNSARGIGEGGVWGWDRIPDGATPLVGTQIAGRQQAIENADVWMRNYIGKQWTVGYRQPRGQGALIVIGLPVSPDLALALHPAAGVPIHARPELPGVQTALFRRAGDQTAARILIAANLNPHPVQTRVALGSWGSPPIAATDLFSGDRRAMTPDNLVIAIPRASGGIWRLEPATGP